MLKFIFKRIMSGLLVLLGVIVITFVVTRVVPSKPELQWAGNRATEEQLQDAREELGLNKPLHIQFVIYVNDLLHGNLGKSLQTKRPIAQEIKEYLPATLELVLISTMLSVVCGLSLGVLSASKKNRWQDHLARFFSVGTVSLPTFWTALMLQVLFFAILKLLPVGGMLSYNTQLFCNVPHVTGFLLLDCLLTGSWFVLKDALVHFVMPCVVLMLYPTGTVARMTRSAMLEILNEDYIKASRSYGLKERVILWKYALKNCLGPVATIVTLSIGYTLTNTFLVEAIFSWPGIGTYISDAVMNMNYPAIMGVTIISAITYVILNMVADIIVALDPRVRV